MVYLSPSRVIVYKRGSGWLGFLFPWQRPCEVWMPLGSPSCRSVCMCDYLSFQELPANSVLLIYLSATGVFPTGRSDSEGTIKECSLSWAGLEFSLFSTRQWLVAHRPSQDCQQGFQTLQPGLFIKFGNLADTPVCCIWWQILSWSTKNHWII